MKSKDLNNSNHNKNYEKEGDDLVKSKRVKGHYKEVCVKGKCKRVYIKSHLRKLPKKRLISRKSIKNFFGN